MGLLPLIHELMGERNGSHAFPGFNGLPPTKTPQLLGLLMGIAMTQASFLAMRRATDRPTIIMQRDDNRKTMTIDDRSSHVALIDRDVARDDDAI